MFNFPILKNATIFCRSLSEETRLNENKVRERNKKKYLEKQFHQRNPKQEKQMLRHDVFFFNNNKPN